MTPSAPVRSLAGPGWVVVVLAVCVAAEETIFARLGGEVTLKPKAGSVTDATKSITWKVGKDIAVELDEGHVEYFRHFQERSNLDNRTGELTITSLKNSDTNKYTIKIENNPSDHIIHLIVLSPVAVPTISSSCSEDASMCTLTCEGNTTGEVQVTYIWMSDNTEVSDYSEKSYTVKEDSFGVREFSCKMKNPVSEESSKPFSNPYKAAQSGPKISTGLTVFVILLVVVIMVVIVHRLKTGECFFNKSSMPWEGDFWRNTKGEQLQVAVSDSNGTTTAPEKRESEEETMMD
ncbi:uncharacterized protein FYW61_021472 [Anableps anableps]